MKMGYWLLILIMTGIAFELHGRSVVHKEWSIEKVQQAQLAKDALQQRNIENTALEAQQTTINNTLQKEHDEEIRKINVALARSKRLRIGTKFCGDTTRQANTESATSSDGADTTSRLLSEEMDRTVKQLILESEQAAATGRAAQAFIRENGFAE
jgi:LPS O-antigen subunit length determinant protein (WzzB/FepE family)